MNAPFYIYKNPENNSEVVSREKLSKEVITSFDFTDKITEKINGFRSNGLFSATTSTWIIENANKIKLLNVFVMAFAYEILSNMSNDGTNPYIEDDGNFIFSERVILDEFSRTKYNKYRMELIHSNEKIMENSLAENLFSQIYIYIKFIIHISEE